jgi:hypothetical protein
VSQYRKYILAAVFLFLLAGYGGDWLLRRVVRGPLETRRAVASRLQQRIRAKQAEWDAILADAKRLEVWQAQSLPSDPQLARSLYQGWLVQLARHVGLTDAMFDSSTAQQRKDLYHVFGFTLHAAGTLEQLTALLYEFYRAGHLHQIRSLELSPQRGGRISIFMQIEALAIAGVKGKNHLSTLTANKLAYGDFDRYRLIVQRNIFGQGAAAPDASLRLTAVTFSDGVPQAWFSIDSLAQTVRLAQGETLEVGHLLIKLAEVYELDVVVEVDGQRWLLSVGESLGQAAALPPGF